MTKAQDSTVYKLRVPTKLLGPIKRRAAKERRSLHSMMLLLLEWGLSE